MQAPSISRFARLPQIVKDMGNDEEGYASYTFDLESLRNKRSEWGLFRDRREDLYSN